MNKTLLDSVISSIRHFAVGIGVLIVASGKATQEETDVTLQAANSILDSVPALVGWIAVIVGYGAAIFDKVQRNKE